MVDSGQNPRDYYKRGVVITLGSTLVLTASLIGILAFMSNSVTGLNNRLPWYAVGAGIIFVGTILLLEFNESSGQTIIITASGTTLLGLIGIVLAAEGVIFTINYPERVVLSDLLVYLFAAGLFSTGVFYWGVNHWREYSNSTEETEE